MLDLSAKGTVPVFVVNGQVIDESFDIILWSLEFLPLCKQLAVNDLDIFTALALIQQNDTEFKAALDRYKYSDCLTKAEKEEEWQNCLNFMTTLNERLEGQAFLFGDHPSFADYAIFPFIRQCCKVDMDHFAAQELESLSSWMGQIDSSDLFTKVMMKHPLYTDE